MAVDYKTFRVSCILRHQLKLVSIDTFWKTISGETKIFDSISMMVNTFWRRDTTKFVLLQVLVTNSLLCLSSVTGGATKCNTKTVIPEVDISSSPPDRTQPIGAAISLICEAWPRADDELQPRRSIKYIEWYGPNGTRTGVKCSRKLPIKKLSCRLLLKNLTEENFGNYTCEAQNDYDGYCRRKSVEIRRTENVNLPETTKAPHFLFPEIAEDPMNQSVFIGSNVTFNCTARGLPTPAISWMKNNDSYAVTSNVRANVQGNKNNHSQLIITEVKKEDSGRYQCVASNSAGEKTSSVAFLHIKDFENVNLPETTKAPHFLFPEIAEDPMNQSVFIGSNVTFNCTARGLPTPAISWMKNNDSHAVTSNVRANVQGNKNNHSQLIITEVKKEDSGRYQCVASNSAGKRTSSEAFLHIEDLEFKMNQEAVKEKCSTSSQISVTILSCAIIAAFIGGMCVGFCFRTIRRSEKITFYTANEPEEEKNELQQFKQR